MAEVNQLTPTSKTAEPSISTRFDALLIGITGLAAFLRLYGLAHQSLAGDEFATCGRIMQADHAAVHGDPLQGLLFYELERIFCRGFGYSESMLRLLPALLGIVLVPVTYLVAKNLFDRTTAIYAALLLTVTPAAIAHAQEARAYTLYPLCVSLSIYCTLRLAEAFRPATAIRWVLATVTALYTHPYGIFLLPCLAGIYFAWRWGNSEPVGKDARWLMAMLTVAGVLYLPQVLRLLTGVHDTARAGDDWWIKKPTFVTLLRLPRNYFHFYPLGGAIALLGAYGLVRFPYRDRKKLAGLGVLLAVVLLFVLAPWLVSRVGTPIYSERYTLPALLSLVIFCGWTLSTLHPPWRQWVVVVLLALATVPLFTYYTGVTQAPWRSAADYLLKNVGARDVILVEPSGKQGLLHYYFGPAAPCRIAANTSWEKNREEMKSAGTVWLVTDSSTLGSEKIKALADLVGNNRVRLPAVDINAGLKLDPYALLIRDITVTCYQPKPKND